MTYLVLVPLSIAMGLIGLGAFFWALRNDQFDDPEGAAERVLMPDAGPLRPRGSTLRRSRRFWARDTF